MMTKGGGGKNLKKMMTSFMNGPLCYVYTYRVPVVNKSSLTYVIENVISMTYANVLINLHENFFPHLYFAKMKIY